MPIVQGTSTIPSAPGLYVQVLTPPSFVEGVPVDVIGVSGTASWGPLNSPTLLGAPSDVIQVFGGITAAALTDQHDLCTDLIIAFSQAQSQSTLQAYGVRVSDGTDIKATATIKDSGNTITGITINALYSGTLGNSISVTISSGATAPSTFDVVVTPFSGGLVERYTGLPSTSAFWQALINAFANGLPNVRGPSLLVRGVIGTSVLGPVAGTTTLASGTDGRGTITSAELIGSNAAFPYTGLYALEALNPPVGILWAAGFTDNTGLANLVGVAQNTPAWCLFSAATGAASNTTTLVTTLQGYGQADYHLSFTANWVYWYDPVNGQVRLVPPYAFIGGTVATLGPEQSPLNVPVSGVVGTERDNPFGTPQPYSYAELGALDKAGIIVITNPIPAGQVWGMASGRNTSLNPAQSPVEYARLTNFLALSLVNSMGQFVGQNQSQQPNDPLRSQVKHSLDTFLQGLKDAQRIDGFLNTCALAASGNPNMGINTPATISQHYLYARSDITYLSSVWYFVLSLQGGTTVVTTGSAAGPQPPL